MSPWLLPDHIADILPSEARRIEDLRRDLLDMARSYGYELVIPPLIEHLDSLLTGTGEALDLRTFKLVDQLSGRTLGIRADTTPQVARIDAHLLGRSAMTRLCYCGPVLHTRPDGPQATREPLQFGAEIYGHVGLEADLESQQLALDCLGAAGVGGLSLDLADVRIVRALLSGQGIDPAQVADIHQALATKDTATLAILTARCDSATREALRALPRLYGDITVLAEARETLPALPAIHRALDDLAWLALRTVGARVSIDLADLRGYAYYSGARYAIYADGAPDALVRGGRYDGVGAVFGHRLDRDRPAVGFSLDLRQLVTVAATPVRRAAIRAPWRDSPELRTAVSALRARGETVVCVLPGHENETDEFQCDRELLEVAGQWVVHAL